MPNNKNCFEYLEFQWAVPGTSGWGLTKINSVHRKMQLNPNNLGRLANSSHVAMEKYWVYWILWCYPGNRSEGFWIFVEWFRIFYILHGNLVLLMNKGFINFKMSHNCHMVIITHKCLESVWKYLKYGALQFSVIIWTFGK